MAAASASASTLVAERTRIASTSTMAASSSARSAPLQLRISKSGPSASTVAGLSSSAMSTTGRSVGVAVTAVSSVRVQVERWRTFARRCADPPLYPARTAYPVAPAGCRGLPLVRFVPPMKQVPVEALTSCPPPAPPRLLELPCLHPLLSSRARPASASPGPTAPPRSTVSTSLVGPGRSGLVGTQRVRQVDPAAPDRRRAAPDRRPRRGRRRGRLPAAGPHPRRRPAGGGVPRHRRGTPRAIRAVEAGVDRPAPLRRHRRRLGHRGAGRSPSSARLGLPARRARPAARRALGRRGHPARAGPAAAAPPGRAAARRADQQPRRRRPAAALRRRRGLEPARCSWSATTASCSSGWTGSATCATARCGGTAAATRRTPTRCGRAGGGPAGGDHRDGPTCAGSSSDRVEAERVLAQRRSGKKAEAQPGSDAARSCREEEAGRRGLGRRATASVHEDRARQARERLGDAEARLREDREIRVDLPGTEVPRGRLVLTTADLVIRTGDAVDLDCAARSGSALVGANGSGKTTLLRTIAGWLDRVRHGGACTSRSGCSPSGSTCSTTTRRVFEQRRRPGTRSRRQRGPGPAGAVPVPGRARPTGWSATSPAASGSGRRWPRCCWPTPPLSCCCSTSRPTTSTSRRTTPWSSALGGYRGALVVASHDAAFLEDIGVDRTVAPLTAALAYAARMAIGDGATSPDHGVRRLGRRGRVPRAGGDGPRRPAGLCRAA